MIKVLYVYIKTLLNLLIFNRYAKFPEDSLFLNGMRILMNDIITLPMIFGFAEFGQSLRGGGFWGCFGPS